MNKNAALSSISTSVTELEHSGMRFFATRTGSKDVVTIIGSVFGGSNMLPRSKVELPDIAAELLDAGTSTKSKEVLRESLGSRGASISFSAGGDRMHFSASCFPEDVSFTLKMIVECLSEAVFPAAEIKAAKERALGELTEEKSDTRSVASTALARALYDSVHVNYAESLAARKASIEAVTRAELMQYRKMLGQGGLVLAIVGDIQPESVLQEAMKVFKKLPAGTPTAPSKSKNKKAAAASEDIISVPDKANIDTYLGVAVPCTYDDPVYLPFTILTQMLGGHGFTSHLMSTVRERDGLTYGVYAMPSGFSGLADGDFRVWATFSPEKFDQSVAALRKEISHFFKQGITEEKLEARKDEVIGSYIVGLSTTGGFATMLHSIGAEGKSLGYVDEFPELVQAVTIQDVLSAAKLIQLDKLSLAAAGTFTPDKPKVKSKRQ